MKKLLPIIFLLCLALTLAACAGQTPQSPQTTETQETPTPQDETEEATAEGTQGTALPQETEAQETPTGSAPETAEPPEETETKNTEPATIALVWADDWEDDIADLAACSIDEAPQTAFVICTDNTVTDFEIISLYEPEFTEDGPMSFSYTGLYSHGVFLPEAPLLVRATFYGDLPNFGIRYTDADGAVKTYAIEISGMNGSLNLTQIAIGGAA